MNRQRTITTEHINLYIRKARFAEDAVVKSNYINKVIGILSLAKALDIITLEEYETYFNQLFK
jgi:hypothetical protein